MKMLSRVRRIIQISTSVKKTLRPKIVNVCRLTFKEKKKIDSYKFSYFFLWGKKCILEPATKDFSYSWKTKIPAGFGCG